MSDIVQVREYIADDAMDVKTHDDGMNVEKCIRLFQNKLKVWLIPKRLFKILMYKHYHQISLKGRIFSNHKVYVHYLVDVTEHDKYY